LGAVGGEDRQWLSQVEIRTHALRSTPAWASPQITFHVFTASEDKPDASIIEQSTTGACWHNRSNPLHVDQRPCRELQVVRGSGPGIVVHPSPLPGSSETSSKQGLAADLGAALGEALDDADFFPFQLADEEMDVLDCEPAAHPTPLPGPTQQDHVPVPEPPSMPVEGAGTSKKKKKKNGKKHTGTPALQPLDGQREGAQALELARPTATGETSQQHGGEGPQSADFHAEDLVASPSGAALSSAWVLTPNPNVTLSPLVHFCNHRRGREDERTLGLGYPLW